MIVVLLLAILVLFIVLLVLRNKKKENYITQQEVETSITNATTSATSANNLLTDYDTAVGKLNPSFAPSILGANSFNYISDVQTSLSALTGAYGDYLSLANTNVTLTRDIDAARTEYVNALIDENLALAAQGNALAAKNAADLAKALADAQRLNAQSTGTFWSTQATNYMNNINNTLLGNLTGAVNNIAANRASLATANSELTTSLSNETRARTLNRDINKIPISYSPDMWGFTAPTTILTEATAKTNLINANKVFTPNYPATISGLVGWYDGDSWETVPSLRWRDKSGVGNHVTTFRGTPTKVTSTLSNNTKTFSTLQGTVNDGMTFPTSILPATYTLFTVARYTDVNNARRIFDGVGFNWLSGFVDARLGVAYHEGWITPDDNGIQSADYPLTSWLMSSDVSDGYWANGVNRKSPTSSASLNARLTINNGQFSCATCGQKSAWQASLVLVYNRKLTDTERQSIEAWISYQYGLTSPSFTAAKSALALANLQYNQATYKCSTTIPNMTMPIRLNAAGNAECLSEDGTNCKVLVTNPAISGLVGWYDGDSWEASPMRWRDKSGVNNHVTTFRGTPTLVNSVIANGSTKSFKTLQGTVNDGMTFPTAILPATYTLFTVGRYTDVNNARRIFDGTVNNWLSGFWGGNIGVAHHTGWVTSSAGTQSTAYPVTNWITSTDMNDNYWVNGVPRKVGTGNSSTNLTINNGQISCATCGEKSAWQVALVLVFNRKLNDFERISIEKWISDTYGITTANSPASCNTNILNTYTFNPFECATSATVTTLPSWCTNARTELTVASTPAAYTPTTAQTSALASANSALATANSAYTGALTSFTNAQTAYNNQISGLRSNLASITKPFMYGSWINSNLTYAPVARIEAVGSNTVYMFQDGDATKMVDNLGNAKYYIGPMTNFSAANWNTYTNAQGNYKLRLCPNVCTNGCDVTGNCNATVPPTS